MERGQADAGGLMDLKKAQQAAMKAARAVGALMRANLSSKKTIDSSTQHDIKLELDVRCQRLIEKSLRSTFPSVAVLGEEGISGDPNASDRWVVDPIDGTVNFTYGIPHACISIALQPRNVGPRSASSRSIYEDGYQT